MIDVRRASSDDTGNHRTRRWIESENLTVRSPPRADIYGGMPSH